MIGDVQETKWTTIAHEVDGVPVSDDVGRVIVRWEGLFAYRAEAEEWLELQRRAGHGWGRIGAIATGYFGPTDSPSNCWSAIVEREVIDP